ncbi:MAG: hypothetical protein ACE5IA_07040 [Dehalococcoidia bacterium]
MTDQKQLWEMPEPEPAGHRRGRRPRDGKAGPASDQVDTGLDTVPADPIEEMVGALTDPIIVFPGGGWEDTIPQHLKDRVPLDRLAHQMKCFNGKAQWDEAPDVEALIYMYPRTLQAPLSEQWTRIYLYLGTVCLGAKFPDDIRQESLSDYDMEELRGLKRWIYKKRRQARRDRKKAKKAKAVVAVEAEQPRMF